MSTSDRKDYRSEIIIGLDLSLSSPGIVAFIHEEDKTDWICGCVPSSKTQHLRLSHESVYSNGNQRFRIKSLMQPIARGIPYLLRMSSVTNAIVSFVEQVQTSYPGRSTVVYLEGYAHSYVSAAATKLHEIGGAVRYKLCGIGCSIFTVPPSSVKRLFTGDGHASKLQMMQCYEEKGFMDLYRYFGLTRRESDVPNPLQDVVDAVALAYIQQYEHLNSISEAV